METSTWACLACTVVNPDREPLPGDKDDKKKGEKDKDEKKGGKDKDKGKDKVKGKEDKDGPKLGKKLTHCQTCRACRLHGELECKVLHGPVVAFADCLLVFVGRPSLASWKAQLTDERCAALACAQIDHDSIVDLLVTYVLMRVSVWFLEEEKFRHNSDVSNSNFEGRGGFSRISDRSTFKINNTVLMTTEHKPIAIASRQSFMLFTQFSFNRQHAPSTSRLAALASHNSARGGGLRRQRRDGGRGGCRHGGGQCRGQRRG